MLVKRSVLHHARQIRENGMLSVVRKLRSLLQLILLTPVVLAIRALRPLMLIRIGALYSSRIGHYAGNPEVYLCRHDAGMYPPRTLDFFYNTPPIANHQLKKMWDRTLRVTQLVGPLDRVNRKLPGGQAHIVPLATDRDIHGLFVRFEPHLHFTEEEERQGRAALRKIGVGEDQPFVCFHARDSAYLDSFHAGVDDWRYHSYRDSSIHNYIPAVKELVSRGYVAFRMGRIVKEPLGTDVPGIIDYATKYHSDFMDIFLAAKCRFFIGQGTGIAAIPNIFRVPIAGPNSISLEHILSWGSDVVLIPKKLWLRAEHRFMSFREILNSGAGLFVKNQQYEEVGIEPIENTPEEITDLVVEMDERLRGTWRTTEEDEDLQRRFWSLFKSSDWHGPIHSRIGATFLRQNRELLE